MRTSYPTQSNIKLGAGINTLTDELAEQAVLIGQNNSKDTNSSKSSTDKQQTGTDLTISIPLSQLLNVKPKDTTTATSGTTDSSKTDSTGQKNTTSSSSADTTQTAKPSTALVATTYPANSRRITSQTYVLTSLSELQRKFDASLSISVPQINTGIKLDLSSIQKQSTQELYYVLELRCIEKAESLNAPYELYAPLQKQLAKADNPVALKRFFDKYGDSYVNTITYGRWALVVIQFKLLNKEHQSTVSAKLSATGKVDVDASISNTLSKRFQGEEYTVKVFSGGLDYTAPGILSPISEIDKLVQKFSVQDQKSDPAIIDINSTPYQMAINEEPNIADETKTANDQIKAAETKLTDASTKKMTAEDAKTAADQKAEEAKVDLDLSEAKDVTKKLASQKADIAARYARMDLDKKTALEAKAQKDYDAKITAMATLKQQAQAAQLKAIQNAAKLNNLTTVAKNLLFIVHRTRQSIRVYLHALNYTKIDRTIFKVDKGDLTSVQENIRNIQTLLKTEAEKSDSPEITKNISAEINAIQNPVQQDLGAALQNLKSVRQALQRQQTIVTNNKSIKISWEKLIVNEKKLEALQILENIVAPLLKSDKQLEDISHTLQTKWDDLWAVEQTALQIKQLIKKLSKINSNFPDYLTIPLMRVPFSNITHTKHKKGEYHFHLDPPDKSDYLKLYVVDKAGNLIGLPISELELKQRLPVIPKEFQKGEAVVDDKAFDSKVTCFLTMKQGENESSQIPIVQKLESLYLKPSADNTQAYNVDIYVHFDVSKPANDLTPSVTEIDRVLETTEASFLTEQMVLANSKTYPATCQIPGKNTSYIEVDAPSDGACLFYSVALSALLQARYDEKNNNPKGAFQKCYNDLFASSDLVPPDSAPLLAALNGYKGDTEWASLHLKDLVNNYFRVKISKQIEANRAVFEPAIDVECDFPTYVKKILEPSFPGSEHEIVAMANILGKEILAYRYLPDNKLEQSKLSYGQKKGEPIYLIHSGIKGSENHYHYAINPIYASSFAISLAPNSSTSSVTSVTTSTASSGVSSITTNGAAFFTPSSVSPSVGSATNKSLTSSSLPPSMPPYAASLGPT
ncbi:hypothetical protein AYO45_00960 [Gammaproteobacteria bacterium SCGC AG-212-F23]|nr:hypothetical protein AYO45_00960 [Gammaproteobacteria bacterium SCGC AG-212-F23]